MPDPRYIRQAIFEPIGEEGQRRISAGSAVVVGCGALGSNSANNLGRSGVGRLRIVDRDFVELDNLQRQVLFDEDDVGRRMPKAVAAAERLRRINTSIALEAEVAEIAPGNIERLIGGFDVVVDGTDNVETRLLVNDACQKLGVPFIFGGAVGSTGMTMAIVPGATPCFRCLMAELPEPGTAPTAATSGILHSVTAVVASLQCVQALQVLVGALEPSDELLCVDVWTREFEPMSVPRRPDCPACGKRRFEFLDAPAAARAVAVPGTSSVRLPGRGEVSLEGLAASWRGVGEVVANDWLVSLTAGGRELIVFRDGRGVVKGTDDADGAQALYDAHVG